MGKLNDYVEHVTESFQGLFNLEAEPGLSPDENVERVIGQTATVAALVACVQPFPLADFLVLSPIQAKMCLHVGRLKGFEVSPERANEILKEIVGAVWLSLASQLVVTSVAKLVPFVGGLLTVPMVYAATWSIGRVADYYFDCLRSEQRPSASRMKDLFAEELAVGKARGQALDPDDVARRAEELRRRVEGRDAALRTRARLDPRGAPERGERGEASGDAAGRAVQAPAGPASDPEARPGGPRQKIKVVLGPRDPEGPAVGDTPPARGPTAKTIGPDGWSPPPSASAPRADDATAGAPRADDAVSPAAHAATARRAVDGEAGATPAAGQRAAPGADLVDQLERLAKLRAAGVLTDDELAAAKRRLLGL